MPVKELPELGGSLYNGRREYARRDVVITDIVALVPEDNLLRKIEKVMDYGWLYERLDPHYNYEVG